jgi:hypothetical protein
MLIVSPGVAGGLRFFLVLRMVPDSRHRPLEPRMFCALAAKIRESRPWAPRSAKTDRWLESVHNVARSVQTTPKCARSAKAPCR